ncbi:MAG: tetratricopeptide repeat protein [Treponema sp.]|jgi:tetratricopeptide (TPR) repeat protein|nr:tetratricopeptide repeat protein [Treponema sp.]
MKILWPLFAAALLCSTLGCVSSSVKAEEYYAMGEAYFNLKKYPEAERWFKKALGHKKTQAAAEYNLGRSAFELGRYDDAERYFERILARDPENITALRAAAYTCIKTGKLDKAEGFYQAVLALAPENADEGYNHALVLMALGKSGEAEALLLKSGMPEGADALHLLARAQKEQGKPEAVDTYKACLSRRNREDIRFEYAEVLEAGEFYAKALEEYRGVLRKIEGTADSPDTLPADTGDGGSYAIPEVPLVLFRIARVLLIADPNDPAGSDAFSKALDGGYNDQAELDKLIARLPEAKRGPLSALRAEKQRQDGGAAAGEP